MSNHLFRVGVVVVTAVVLTACTSARFGGPGPTAPRAGVIAAQPERLSPGMAAPSGVVFAEPLAPPAGASELERLPTITGGAIAEGEIGQRQAAVSPSAPARTSRTNFVGSWRATEAGGSSCRVTLSSTPALDLYRASTSGCSNQEISRVNSWDLRGSEIYLYQQGGAVAARLQATPGTMQGVIARSGAPLTMAR